MKGRVDRERLDTWCERGVLGLMLAILVYAPLATGAVRPRDFVVVQWLTVAMLAVWGCRFAINPKHRLFWPWVCWPVLGFMLYAVGRYFTADIEYVARQELVRVLIYGFVFFAVLHNLHRQEFTQLLGMTLISLGMVIALYAVGQYLTGSDHVWHFLRPEVYRERASGTFINPNNLAGYLEMLLPLALTYTLTSRAKDIGKVVMGYSALVIFAGIVVTFSRYGWVAAGISLTVMFVWLLRQHDYRLPGFLALAGFLAIIALVWVTAQPARGRPGRLTLAAQTEDVRFKLWGPAIQIWQDHPWWGAGPDHFDSRFRQYRPADEALQARPERAHNDYLNALADWGVAGALLLAAIWGLFYGEVFRSWKYVQRAQTDLAARRSNKASFVLGGALGLLAILAHSVFDFNLHIPANALLAATLLALVGGHFRFATERHWHTVRWPLRVPVAVGLLGALAFLGTQAWQHTRECYWLGRAEAPAATAQEQIDALQRAFAADGRNFETAYQLGEVLRLQSWQGGDDYRKLAEAALPWFKRSMELNPFFPYSLLRYGMCLHWLGRHDEAETYFNRARELDPHGYYTIAHLGWHYVQVQNWTAAKKWFEESLRLNRRHNPIATSYLEIVNRKLEEVPAPQEPAP